MTYLPNMEVIRRVARSRTCPRPSYDLDPTTGKPWAEDDEDKKPQGFASINPRHCKACGRRWPFKGYLCGYCLAAVVRLEREGVVPRFPAKPEVANA